MRIVLIGSTGQIGWELRKTLAPFGELITTARNDEASVALDATDLSAVLALLKKLKPDVVVNACAYTAVDQAESERELAYRLNGALPAVIGQWAAHRGATVVHYSTDYVFDGTKTTPYRESDEPNPLSVYGRSKLAGDDSLLHAACNVFILRVGWVYGARRSNFALKMKHLLTSSDPVRVVDDQIGGPNWCRDIARSTAQILSRLHTPGADEPPPPGLYHLAPSGSTSWFGFAQRIADELGLSPRLEAITADEYTRAAIVPRYSVLDTRELTEAFDLPLPDWQTSVAELCAQWRPATQMNGHLKQARSRH